MINSALISYNKIGPCIILRAFLKYLDLNQNGKGAYLKMQACILHTDVHTPTKATTYRIHILERIYRVYPWKKKKISFMQEASKETPKAGTCHFLSTQQKLVDTRNETLEIPW